MTKLGAVELSMRNLPSTTMLSSSYRHQAKLTSAQDLTWKLKKTVITL